MKTYLPALNVFIAWCLIMQKDKFFFFSNLSKMKSRFLGYTAISVLYSTIFLTFTITHFSTATVHMCNPAGFGLHMFWYYLTPN